MALTATALGVSAGCGTQAAVGNDSEALRDRARQVAQAWDDDSTATAAWRTGYYPMEEEVQLPQGGLHDKVDEHAYEKGNFALRGKLPSGTATSGRVTWAGDKSLTQPLIDAEKAYESLARNRAGERPQLTVTGAKLGTMRVATSRGPATVPAWLFTLDGYDAPLKASAVHPSKRAQTPIKRADDVPGLPVNRLIAEDGRSVTVIALHGACDNGPKVEVLETRGSVVLSATVKRAEHDGNCTKQAKMQQVTVELKRPLGSRILLDAITGRPILHKGPQGIASNES
ncbi:hypothetical protein DY218_30555 [Streptomyces triticagri]|uniref:Uncharacterized protein n=1 Tax=Streptomyces triticagri TaxID=2293568 RepID=A0A372LW56_9ACTN|nr:hypothetical protein DY218_30555 [Streptomyces triticagri]